MMKKRRKNKKPANGRAKRRYVLYGVLGWLVFSYALLFVYLPDEIYLTKAEQQEGQPLAFADGLPIGIDYEEDVQPVFGAQRTLAASENDGVLTCRLFDLIPLKQVVVHYTDRANVVAAGTNIGIYLKNSGVLVVECASFTDQNGALIAPAAYRIRSGDVIVKVDGRAHKGRADGFRRSERRQAHGVTRTACGQADRCCGYAGGSGRRYEQARYLGAG